MDKPIIFNDLKAPRFNPRKFRKIVVNRELFIRWKKANHIKRGVISYDKFKLIWDLIAQEIVNTVLEERDGVNLRGLGDIYIGYIPNVKNKPIDHKSTEKYGKTIYFDNWHTDGKIPKIIWGVTGRRYVPKRKYWWAFEPCRNMERAMTKAVHENPSLYKNSQERRHVEKAPAEKPEEFY